MLSKGAAVLKYAEAHRSPTFQDSFQAGSAVSCHQDKLVTKVVSVVLQASRHGQIIKRLQNVVF